MEPVHGLILALFLIAGAFLPGCISEDTPSEGSAGGNARQPGVVLQTVGNITGQGVILQGVPRGTIDTITFTVGLAPGAGTADLRTLTIVYSDVVRTEIFTPVAGYRGSPPPSSWGILDTLNEAGDPNLRMDFDEQVVIRINPRAPVVPNQVITISAKPEEGKPVVIRCVAPSTIREDENILPTL